MRRLLVAILFAGLLAGCGDSKPATPPDDPESLRRAEEEAQKEGKREDANKKGKKGDRADRGEDD